MCRALHCLPRGSFARSTGGARHVAVLPILTLLRPFVSAGMSCHSLNLPWHAQHWHIPGEGGGGGGWHKASVSDCLPLAAPIGLSPLPILTLCGPERVLVVSTEPPDDLSCLTTPGVGRREGGGGG